MVLLIEKISYTYVCHFYIPILLSDHIKWISVFTNNQSRNKFAESSYEALEINRSNAVICAVVRQLLCAIRYITEIGLETCINEESEHSRTATAWMCEICGDDFERVGEQVS